MGTALAQGLAQSDHFIEPLSGDTQSVARESSASFRLAELSNPTGPSLLCQSCQNFIIATRSQ